MAMNAGSYFELYRLTLPESIVALAALLTLTLDIVLMKRATMRLRLHVCALAACAGCLAAIYFVQSSPVLRLADGMLALTPLTAAVQTSLLCLTILTLLLCDSIRFTEHVGEYLGLILFATVALMFLVSSQNLLLIFISLEFLSLSLYLLTGFDKQRRESAEAALKYFLFGGMSAGFLLFGISLLYGLAHSLDLHEVAIAVGNSTPNHLTTDPLMLVAIVMVAIGFGFKVAAAPFHFWAPDAYQGAPATSAGFIASSSKVASFFVFAQVVTIGLAGAAGSTDWHRFTPGWVPVLTVLSALSMVLGNLAAIAQSSLRRLLAYSAVGHAGYILLGIVTHTPQSLSALLYYILTYALAALGAFGVLGALDAEGVDSLPSLAGLSRRSPSLAFCLLIFLLSLAGIPPLSGFFAKFYLFGAALNTGDRLGLLWLVLLAIAMSAISLYYYLRVLKQVYVAEVPDGAGPVRTSPLTSITIWIIAGLVVLLGCAPNLLLSWIGSPTAAMHR
jgi:NADH-quinone oxidoreductase subunit N